MTDEEFGTAWAKYCKGRSDTAEDRREAAIKRNHEKNHHDLMQAFEDGRCGIYKTESEAKEKNLRWWAACPER